MAGDPHSSDPWRAIADRANPMIVRGIFVGVLGAIGIGMALVIAPAGHVMVTVIWIIFGFLEFVALLFVVAGVLGRVAWKRRHTVLHRQPPADITDKRPASSTSPPTL